MNTVSPLRYPGGKAMLADILGQVIEINNLSNCCFVEPFGGGAGAALTLLVNEFVDRIIINDLDPAICSFWNAALYKTNQFNELIASTPVTIDEWHKQREIYHSLRTKPCLRLGFAAFYLNRCNRSGIIHNGGVIGGLKQNGQWGVTARFNQDRMIERITTIGELRDRITVSNMDGLELLKLADLWSRESDYESVFCFVDPPYIEKGNSLYWSSMEEDDHEELAQYLCNECGFRWLVTYDDCELARSFYEQNNYRAFEIIYSASVRRTGAELMATSQGLLLPENQRSLRMIW